MNPHSKRGQDSTGATVGSRRTTLARTHAALGAVAALADALAKETGPETARSDSAHQKLRAVLYDLFDGAYWDGYMTGEDEASMRPSLSPKLAE
jgi:hypothetical protein